MADYPAGPRASLPVTLLFITWNQEWRSMLTGIVYLSSALAPFDEKALRELAEHAQRRNRELDVTGYLYFEQRQFIQYIEGPSEPVTALMQRIAADRRHDVRITLEDRDLGVRRFPDWSMRHVTNASMVSLEQILRDHLSLVMSLKPASALEPSTVWRMVDTLSQNRARLLPAA
jgi:hypothetical protein